jgi:hypothetical protein
VDTTDRVQRALSHTPKATKKDERPSKKEAFILPVQEADAEQMIQFIVSFKDVAQQLEITEEPTKMAMFFRTNMSFALQQDWDLARETHKKMETAEDFRIVQYHWLALNFKVDAALIEQKRYLEKVKKPFKHTTRFLRSRLQTLMILTAYLPKDPRVAKPDQKLIWKDPELQLKEWLYSKQPEHFQAAFNQLGREPTHMTVTELVSCFDNFQIEEVKERAAKPGGGQQNGKRHGNGNGNNHNGGRGRGRGFNNNNVGGRGRGRSSTRGGSHAGRGNNSASCTKWCQIEGYNSPPHLWENCSFNKRRSPHDLPQEEQQHQKHFKSNSISITLTISTSRTLLQRRQKMPK